MTDMVQQHADWLLAQLEAWPTRVDPDKTINVEYLMKSAADRIKGLAAHRQAAMIEGARIGMAASAKAVDAALTTMGLAEAFAAAFAIHALDAEQVVKGEG